MNVAQSVKPGRVRLAFDRLHELLARFGKPSLVRIELAEPVVSREIERREAHRRLILRRRLVRQSHFFISHSQVELRVGVIRLEPNSALEILDSLRITLLPGTHQSQVVEDDDAGRSQFQTLAPLSLRLLHIALAPVNHSQVVANRVGIRRSSQRSREQHHLVSPVAITRDDADRAQYSDAEQCDAER